MKRQLLAEYLGTAGLVSAVIGSGIMASSLSGDSLVVLLANALATVFALLVLISVFAPVSGSHFNPAVSLALALNGSFPKRLVPAFILAQLFGAISGVVITNLMFQRTVLELSDSSRLSFGTGLGEVVATAGLAFVIVALLRSNREQLIAPTVALWIGSAYFFTSSTSFANPAVTVARVFTDSVTGIDLYSAAIFVVMQIIGATLGLIAARLVFRKKKVKSQAKASGGGQVQTRFLSP